MKWSFSNKNKNSFRLNQSKNKPIKVNAKKSKTAKSFSVSGRNWYSSNANKWWNVFSLLQKPNYYHWFFCIISGLLAGFCLPTEMNSDSLSLLKTICPWFALAPMFAVIWISSNIQQASAKAFVTGLVFNLIGFRFVLGIHPLSWLGISEHLSLAAAISGLLWASLQQAFFWAVYSTIFKTIQKTLGVTPLTPFQGAIIWIIWIEKIANSLKFGGIPWTSYYYTQHNNLYLIQVSDLVSASLVSFLLIFVNITLAHWIVIFLKREGKVTITHLESPSQQLKILLLMSLQSVALLFLAYFYGFFAVNNISKELTNSRQVKALLLQKNFDVSETRIKQLYSFQNVNDYLKLFKKVFAAENSQLVVIPEGAIPQKHLEGLATELIKSSPQSNSVIGSYFYDTQSEKSYNVAAAFASSLHFSNSKTCSTQQPEEKPQQQTYMKQALAPFGEYTPFEPIMRRVFKQFHLESLADSSFESGKEATIFNLSFGKIGPLICYEVIFPSLFERQIQAGAQTIVVIGDASWFHTKTSLVNSQMMAALQFRAIEGRRDVLVSVNKGPLAVINQLGQIKSYSEAEFSFVDFHLNDKRSLTSKSAW